MNGPATEERTERGEREDQALLSISSHFASLLIPLLHVMKASRTATRLSVAAAESLCAITAMFASYNLPVTSFPYSAPSKPTNRLIVEIGGRDTIDEMESTEGSVSHMSRQHLLVQHLGVLLEALRILVKWYEGSRNRLSKALQELISSYEIAQARGQSYTVIVQSWKLISGYISLVPTQRQTTKLISEFNTMITVKSHDSLMDYYRVLSLEILCSSLMNNKQVVAFLEKYKAAIFPFLVEITNIAVAQAVVVDLLQQGLFDPEFQSLGEYIYELLPDILLAEYELNSDLVAFLARVIIWYGQSNQLKLLLRTTETLNSTQPYQQENAANIIVNLLKHNDTNTKVIIQKALLDNPNNRNLFDKIAARGLYNYFDLEYVIPKLASIVRASEGDTTAASKTLVEVCAHSDPFRAFQLLLNSCRANQNTKLISPADIGVEKKDSDNEHWVSQVMDIVATIAPKIEGSCWSPSLPALVRLYLDTPQDAILVKFLAKIASYIGHYLTSVLPMLVDVMKSQKGLTEEMLKATTPESENTIKKLIFERLAPLLVLKVVPFIYFTKFWDILEDAITALRDLLILRMMQTYEFEEVRRVSALVLSYLPPSVWALPTIQSIQDSISKQDYYNAKICIFTWFNALSIQGALLYNYAQLMVSVILAILVIPCPTPSTEVSEIQKLQTGGIDCLAIMMKIAFDKPLLTSYDPLNVDARFHNEFFYACQHHVTGFHDIPQLVVGLAMPPFLLGKEFHIQDYEKTKHQLFMGLVNAIINCIKACSDSCISDVAEVFLKPSLNSIVTTHTPSSLLRGYLQAVDIMITKLKGRVSIFEGVFSDFLAVALSNKAFKVVGLNVLNAVTTYDQNITVNNSDVVSSLQEACNEEDSEVRKLAKAVLALCNVVQDKG